MNIKAIVGLASALVAIQLAAIATAQNATAAQNATTPQNATVTPKASTDVVVASLEPTFDCRRIGHDCDPVGTTECHQDSGKCLCASGYVTFNCAYKLSQVAASDSCGNGEGCGEALCMKPESGQPVCACPYSAWGSECTKPRIELRCSSTHMTVNVAPYAYDGQFVGQIFVLDMNSSARIDDAPCKFSNITNGTTSLKVTYEELQGKCGGKSVVNQTESLKFVIQSDETWLTTFDQIITATCSVNFTVEYKKTIMVNATGLAGVPGPDGRLIAGAEPAKISSDLSGVSTDVVSAQRKQVELVQIMPHPRLTLGKAKKTPNATVIDQLDSPVKIGDIIVFTVENVNDTFYEALRVEQCELRLSDQMRVELIRDACPASRLAWSLLMWKDTVATQYTTSFFLRVPASAFSGRPREVIITCKIKMCSAETTNQCEVRQDACTSTTSKFLPQDVRIANYGRKRRSAEPSTVTLRVSRSFRIEYDDEAGRYASTASHVELSLSLVALVAAKMLLL